MLRLSYFIFLILPFCNSAQTPSYETILCYVHDAVKVNPAGGMFEIAKKPDGFYICSNFYSNAGEVTTVDCQQIWNQGSKTFIEPVYPNNDKYPLNEDQNVSTRFSTLWQRRSQLVPMIFYGYKDWVKDTKQLIESKSEPTSIELEALARTYFAEANAFIHPGQYGMEGSEKGEYKDAGYEKLPQERVMGFKKAYDKSLEVWELIRKKDPSHSPNLIMDLDLKIANEYMHGFLTMNGILEPILANEYLNKASYKPSVIEYAKMTLDECEKNAILLTNGDSDTYPLWYVQEKLGYRKDVLVVNISLTQTTWYQELLIDRYKLKSMLTPADLKMIGQRYFVFNGENRISFVKWLKEYQSSLGKTKEQSDNDPNYTMVEGYWDLKYGSNTLEVNGEYYVFSNQLFLYNMIVSNPKRRIFATSFYSFYDLGIQKYGSYFGQLISLNEKSIELQIDPSFDVRLFKQINELSPTYFTGLGNWESLRRSMMLYTCTQVSKDKASEIVTLAEQKIIPTTKINYPSLAASIIEFYQKFDPNRGTTFKMNYEKEAILFVENFVLHPSKIYDDVNELKQLISIYTGLEMFELKPDGFESCRWQGSSQLHEKLTKNLITYYEYCSEHNMMESAKSISDLLDILHVCELN
jgi:hypothetical protein